MSWFLKRFIILSGAIILSDAWISNSHAEQGYPLHYVIEESFLEHRYFDISLSGGWGFSNPYLSIYSVNLGCLWAPVRHFAVGVGLSRYQSKEKEAAAILRDKVSPIGYKLYALAPTHSVAGVVKITPLSGMLNILSLHVWMAEISFLIHAGILDYDGLSESPLIGTGLDIGLYFSPGWGMSIALLWDVDKPQDREWQSRVGFRLGPTVRF